MEDDEYRKAVGYDDTRMTGDAIARLHMIIEDGSDKEANIAIKTALSISRLGIAAVKATQVSVTQNNLTVNQTQVNLPSEVAQNLILGLGMLAGLTVTPEMETRYHDEALRVAGDMQVVEAPQQTTAIAAPTQSTAPLTQAIIQSTPLPITVPRAVSKPAPVDIEDLIVEPTFEPLLPPPAYAAVVEVPRNTAFYRAQQRGQDVKQ